MQSLSETFASHRIRLAGCYEALSGGLVSEALTDFTGGLTERFNFANELPDNMFQIMYKAKKKGSLMGCSIDVRSTVLLCLITQAVRTL